MNILLILITLAFGLMRFFITPRLNLPTATGSYEAFVHLFVGGLFCGWLVDRSKRLWLGLAIALTGLEVVMFIVQKLAN